MKFFALVLSVALASLAAADTLQYDPAYDVEGASLTTVACSDGANGLITRGFSTFKSLPSFPNIGAFSAVSGWNSTNCGTCWEVTYTNAAGESTSLNVLAVDHAGDGLINVSEEAMNTLTDNNAVAFGAVPVTSVQVDASACGL
ncbi:cerato-platanin-related secreted protein [Rhodocollybia butyracea]|uniref:Cerato-platanin-related secreted protein n=1 Tax=Rhodocollybia butyracea TaxID=206335 RepID=A0A9P5PH09_9AGAR|nr:cerato-platanin-related secreted protein [Rhodocollybia butyracea]KAF9063728.1 cerato-platanin-related secreted protein [Rhodocollybia butyracea]